MSGAGRVACVGVVLVLAACAGPPPARAPAVAAERVLARDTILIEAPSHTPYAGSTFPMRATVLRDGVRVPPGETRIHWEIGRTTAAWIAEDGTLTLVEPGTIRLTATDGRRRTERTMEVVRNPVSRVSISPRLRANVRTGDTTRLTATATDRDGARLKGARINYGVSLRGADLPPPARVGEDGLFVADEPGIYIVVAEFGGAADRATIRVRAGAGDADSPPSAAGASGSGSRESRGAGPGLGAVRDVDIERVRHEPFVGTTVQLTAPVSLHGVRGDTTLPVRWSSSDSAVAWVDEDGTVAFLRGGRVRIAAELGGQRDTRSFAVRPPPVARLALTTDAGDVRVGDTVRLREEAWARGATKIVRARANYGLVAHAAGGTPAAAVVTEDARFVAHEPGVYSIIAELGGHARRTTIVVRARSPE